MKKIDARNYDLEERKDLWYDIRDGKIRYEDVIWFDEDIETERSDDI